MLESVDGGEQYGKSANNYPQITPITQIQRQS